MGAFSVFSADGRFLRGGVTPDGDEALQAQPGETLARELATPDHYMIAGAVMLRPALPPLPATIAIGSILSADEMPNGASVRVLDESGELRGAGEIVDHAVAILWRLPGRFTVTIGENDSAWPYRARTYEIEVIEP